MAGVDPNDTIEDEDLHVGYRKYETPRFRVIFEDDDLPDHITKRLAEIRDKALQKFREV